MDKAIEKLLQKQFNTERYNEQAYRNLGYQLANMAWDGTAKFMLKSADEEHSHSEKFANYLIARNIAPELDALPAIKPSVLNMVSPMLTSVSAALDLENKTTDAIVNLYHEADDAGESQTCQFLHWFLEEQTNSVKEVFDMVQEVKRAGNDDAALLDLDDKYGAD